jgi:Glyoxalase-like domain
MAFDFQVAIDCTSPHELADWWAEALGWQVEAQDESFIRRMIEAGHASDDDTTRHHGALVWKVGAAINSPDPGRPRVLFQVAPEPKTVKNRVHLDLHVGEEQIEPTVARLEARGGKRLYECREHGAHWVTMADPEGNEFCVHN